MQKLIKDLRELQECFSCLSRRAKVIERTIRELSMNQENTVKDIRRQVCTEELPDAKPGPTPPFSMYLTREFACLFPDQKCPLCQVFQYASAHKKDPSECRKRALCTLLESRLSQTRKSTTPVKRSKARRLPRRDTAANTADVLFRLALQEPISNCRQAENCLNAASVLLLGKIFPYSGSSLPSIAVMPNTITPKSDKCKEDHKS